MQAETPVLTGIKHCGKSTLGRLLAAALGLPFFDTDDVITEMTGKQPRELLRFQGKAALLLAETEACALVMTKTPAVVATGGGICDNAAALEALERPGGIGATRAALLVFVDVPEEKAIERILRDPGGLPAYLSGAQTEAEVRSRFHDIYEERRKKYQKIARVTFVPGNVSPEENLRRLLETLRSL